MRYAIIENERIVNIAEAEDPLADNWSPLPDGFSRGDLYVNGEFSKPVKPLSDVKAEKLEQIESDYADASTAPVLSLGQEWNGGMNSALALDGAVRISSNKGALTVTLFDVANMPHEVTIADGTTVSADVGIAYQVAFGQRQTRRVALNEATTIDEVNAI